MAEPGAGKDSNHTSNLESTADPNQEVPIIAGNPLPLRGFAATFRSLRHRNYRLYFFGQLVSLVGTWMQMTAVVWVAFELTHESTWTSLVTGASILPGIFGPWGGALADRWPKRSLIFVTQSLFAALALLLAALSYGGAITAWQLLAVTAAGGVVQAVDLPARLAFVVDMVGREDLMNAVGLNSVLFNVARALGPAVGGLLLLWFTPWACFLVNALSYLAVLWALASMKVAETPRAAKGETGFRGLISGFGYLARHRELAFLVLLAFVIAICGWPSQALLPALAERRLASRELGYSLMLSSTGLGALIAAWAVATFGTVERRARMLGVGVVLVCVSLLGLSLVTRLPLAMGCCAVIGFGLILFLATSQSVVQLSARDHNRGRIMGIWTMTLCGAVPLGNLLAGPAADRWGVPAVLAFLGVACSAGALLLFALFRPASIGSQDLAASQSMKLLAATDEILPSEQA